MNTPVPGTVGWFQVGTDDPGTARRFYGELFGWTITSSPTGDGYDYVTYPGAERPSGGIMHTGGEAPNHAIFVVVVADVPAAVASAEQLGGKVLAPPTTTPAGSSSPTSSTPPATTSASSAPPQPDQRRVGRAALA